MGFVITLGKWLLLSALFLAAAVFLVRAVDAMRGPPLKLWHTQAPNDATAEEIDGMDWAQWLAREQAVMAEVRRTVTDALPEADQVAQNRYWADSPVHAPSLPTDWNRSFTLEPTGTARGVVVLLHGLTDAPYSLRHIGLMYQARGFHVVAPRMPGHGTVPAGLTVAEMDDWQATTRLAVREARRRAGPSAPLHMVGYSNGGALTVRHAIAALDDAALGAPDQIILISPMIGLTPFARFSGMAGWPALLPALARAAWLDTISEYNPFKYNSFPVKAAVQSHALTVAIDRELVAARQSGALDRFPPTLAFQSSVDSTVSSRAVASGLFDRLSAGNHELVLFDVNRAARVGPLMRRSALAATEGLITPGPRPYRLSVVTNVALGDPMVLLRSVPEGGGAEERNDIGLAFPAAFHSLGHVALPFPMSDGLYGFTPDPADDQGFNLGALALRGENGTLAASVEALNRASSNPFFDWMAARIAERLPQLPAAALAEPVTP